MTQIISSDKNDLALLISELHPCSYLDGRLARMLYVDPSNTLDISIYSRLSEYGFRRNGNFLYTPHCPDCLACIPSRILISQFKPSNSQKRCCKKNIDVKLIQTSEIDIAEHYPIYASYITVRHEDGTMVPPSPNQFTDYLVTPLECTEYLEYRINNSLVGCSVIDMFENSLSAIYTYFDPDYQSRGLGNYAILKQVELAKKLELDYLYLGYWIESCKKMSYKSRYKGLELFKNNTWQKLK